MVGTTVGFELGTLHQGDIFLLSLLELNCEFKIIEIHFLVTNQFFCDYFDGASVGLGVGDTDGRFEGCSEGARVGKRDGLGVGLLVGISVGFTLGELHQGFLIIPILILQIPNLRQILTLIIKNFSVNASMES